MHSATLHIRVRTPMRAQHVVKKQYGTRSEILAEMLCVWVKCSRGCVCVEQFVYLMCLLIMNGAFLRMHARSRRSHAFAGPLQVRVQGRAGTWGGRNGVCAIRANRGEKIGHGTCARAEAPYEKDGRDVPDVRDMKADVQATIAWIGVATGVAGGIGALKGVHTCVEFVTAYIVEYSLSVDNLFVFLLIFNYFKVPSVLQARVLTYGIVGAIVMRGGMILGGAALIHRFKIVSLLFAGLLLYSAGGLLLGDDEEDEDLEQNKIVRFSKRLLSFSDKYDGQRFFTVENGKRIATPLMLVLICIEFSDVVFALDSVPAVLGISNDTFVIYASNILAIMGLRSLYFVLSDAIGELRFLKQAVSIVLGFVGAKMSAAYFGYNVGVVESLAVVVGSLTGGVALSVAFPEASESK